MIHILWSIIVGFLTGAVANSLYPVGSLGFIKTTLLGVAGSFVGGLIARAFSRPAPGAKVHPAGCIMSVVGAIIILFVYAHFIAHAY